MMDDIEQANISRLTAAAGAGIQSADTKATGLVQLGGALLAIVAGLVALRADVGELPFSGILLIAGFAVFSLAAVLASCAALYPRIDRRKLLTGRGWKPLDVSPSYFNDIVTLDRARFLELMKRDASEDQIEQAYVLCIIADRKMLWLRRSVVYFVIACLFLTGFVIAVTLVNPHAANAPVTHPSAAR